MTMADTLAVMRDGAIVQVDRPDTVYRRPLDAWTARFLGDAVLIPVRRTGDHQVTGALGVVDLAPDFDHHHGTEAVMFCRPEQIRPAGASEPGVEAKVLSVRFQGPDAMVTLGLSGDPTGGTEVQARWPSALLPEPGDTARVRIAGTVLAYSTDR